MKPLLLIVRKLLTLRNLIDAALVGLLILASFQLRNQRNNEWRLRIRHESMCTSWSVIYEQCAPGLVVEQDCHIRRVSRDDQWYDLIDGEWKAEDKNGVAQP